MESNQSRDEVALLAAQLEERVRTLLSAEQYLVFVQFGERRKLLPGATATMQEMLALRVVSSDPEARRLREAIIEALRRGAS